MPPPAATPGPRLHGLRLGFPALDLATALLEQVLGLAPAAAERAAPPGQPPRRHYMLDRLRLEVRPQPCAPGGHAGIDGRPESADALQWRQADLASQRRHLQRLGLAALEGVDFGCGPCLRLDGSDTGACAIELREAEAAAHAAQADRAPAGAGPRLAAIDLRVHAPERVATHWARLLGALCGRDADGVPLLAVSPVPVRFVPIPACQGVGVDALVLWPAEAAILAQRACAHGLRVDDDASFSIAGLRVRRAAR